jgi:hypothetical protein
VEYKYCSSKRKLHDDNDSERRDDVKAVTREGGTMKMMRLLIILVGSRK